VLTTRPYSPEQYEGQFFEVLIKGLQFGLTIGTNAKSVPILGVCSMFGHMFNSNSTKLNRLLVNRRIKLSPLQMAWYRQARSELGPFSRPQEAVTSAPSRRPQEPEKPMLVPLEFLMLIVLLTTAISQEITVVQPPIQGGSAVH